MVDEDALRAALRSAGEPHAIDTAAVISRARRRRIPQQLAAGSIGALAVIGIGVLGVQAALPRPVDSTALVQESTAVEADGGTAYDTELRRAPADRLNLCEAPVAEIVPNEHELRLDLVFPESAPADGQPVVGVVRLTNAGGSPVTGITGSTPAITLAMDDVVLWHSNGPTDASAVVVDLAPGAWLEYAASVVPVRCGAEDDALGAFRADLPPLPAGLYRLSAAIDFVPDLAMSPSSAEPSLVTGPATTIRLE